MPRKQDRLPDNEWSHFLSIEDVPHDGLTLQINAPENVQDDLIRRLGVAALKSLQADIQVRPQAGGVYHVSGTFRAEMTQDCVVTGDPVESTLEEPVEGWFIDHDASVMSFAKARQDQEAGKGHAEIEILDESEDPEAVIGGKIDLGELVVQHLSLAINPYPHKEGAQYTYTDEGGAGQSPPESRKNPFEALKDWKEKR